MTAVVHKLDYGTHRIEFRVIRRDRQTMQISVLPDMSVEVIAPGTATEEAIRSRLSKRASWVLRQIQFFRQFHPRTTDRRYVSGETHLYLGRRYRLKVVRAIQAQVRLRHGHIEVHTHYPERHEDIQFQFEAWTKKRAHERFRERLSECLAKFPEPERFQPSGLIIRQLKQRWGSMTPTGRLVLNRALIQASVREIDYVITHELCHRAFHHHGREFFDLLARVMPDWEARKTSLELRLA